MTTPTMESVIQAALMAHQINSNLRCECGHQYFEEDEDADSQEAWEAAYSAHQAGFIAAAISEAGTVEVQFGLDFGDEVSQQDTLEDVHDERDTILGWIGEDEVQASDYGPLAPVTRTILTHIGPWAAVEG